MTQLSAGFGTSVAPDVAEAVREAVGKARQGLSGARPQLALVTATVDCDSAAVYRALRAELPDVPIHGITTSMGILSQSGITAAADGALGVLLLSGSGGVGFGVGSAEIGETPLQAGRQAAQQLAAAHPALGRPKVMLLNAAPGTEEALIQGIGEVLPDVPIYGGSAADNTVAGEWSVFTNAGVFSNAVSLVGFFGELAFGGAFLAPYRPTARRARVTESTGRTLVTLDGRPAADVLADWLGEAIAVQAKEGGNIIVQSALQPVAICEQGPRGEHFIAAHPAHIHRPRGTVDIFARASTGQTLCMMEGSKQTLIAGLADLLHGALLSANLDRERIRAGVLIYCAGCAGSVGADLPKGLKKHLEPTLAGIPLIGLCTFGEQGFVEGLGNLHQNLSLVLLLLGEPG